MTNEPDALFKLSAAADLDLRERELQRESEKQNAFRAALEKRKPKVCDTRGAA